MCYLGLGAGLGFGRELDLSGFEDGVLLENILLRLVVTKRLERQSKNQTHVKQPLLNNPLETSLLLPIFINFIQLCESINRALHLPTVETLEEDHSH